VIWDFLNENSELVHKLKTNYDFAEVNSATKKLKEVEKSTQ
jgi:hypothetical protein